MMKFVIYTLHQTLAYYVDGIKEDEMGVVWSMRGEMRTSYKVPVTEGEGNRPLGRPRRKGHKGVKLSCA
jgi:hypothetical protein